jgi:Uma2 family endonuclease
VPDLVIESVSPSDRAPALEEKVREYLGAGVRLVWVVYPAQRTVHVFREDGSSAVITESGYLDGETVLPGFRIPAESIFQPGPG